MAARKTETVPVQDDLFDENPPTLGLVENELFRGKFVELKHGPDVEVNGEMRPSFIAILEVISGNSMDFESGAITALTAGEKVSYWLFSTVVRDEFKAHRPEPGERIDLSDRGLKLKRAARKAGVSLEDKMAGTYYHNIMIAWPDRPTPKPEAPTFDDL